MTTSVRGCYRCNNHCPLETSGLPAAFFAGNVGLLTAAIIITLLFHLEPLHSGIGISCLGLGDTQRVKRGSRLFLLFEDWSYLTNISYLPACRGSECIVISLFQAESSSQILDSVGSSGRNTVGNYLGVWMTGWNYLMIRGDMLHGIVGVGRDWRHTRTGLNRISISRKLLLLKTRIVISIELGSIIASSLEFTFELTRLLCRHLPYINRYSTFTIKWLFL